jgi:diguanylate cyclase (GGDEF)-like protein
MVGKLRYFTFVFAPIAVVILLGAWSLKQADDALAMVRLESSVDLAVGLGANALTRHLDTVQRDLRYLSAQDALKRLIQHGSSEALAQFTHDALAFSDAARIYDQIRWIDEQGQERVRIDRVDGAAVAIPQAQLQNKKDRYFFTDTMALDPGEVFVSPLDLNIEQGTLQIPYKPMLRFATPVADASGNRRGILILNYLGKIMLDEFAAASIGLSDDIMLLNAEGYWLKGKNPDDEWGFMLNRPITFAGRYPDVWLRIRRSEQGQWQAPSGLWTWRSVYPLQSGTVSSTGTAAAAGPSEARVTSQGYVWKVVSHVSNDQLAALGARTTSRYAWIGATLLALLAVLSWLLAIALDEQSRARRLLERLATTDGLTGLANRRFFIDQVKQYWGSYQRRPDVPVGVLMMDLDHFKSVNDTHGHAAGDMVLQQFGRILRKSLRQTDIAGRIGGEEFCVLLRGSEVEGARIYAERVRRELEAEQIMIGEARLAVTVSIGASAFMPDDSIPTAAMQRADAALYRAKAAGRNRVELAESIPQA